MPKGMFAELMETANRGDGPPSNDQATPPGAPHRLPEAKVGKEGSREVGREGSRESSPAEQPVAFDINEKPYRKDSFLFTDQEFEALEDLKLELRRQYDFKATKNDIARVALSELFDNYKRSGDKSAIIRHLKSKLT